MPDDELQVPAPPSDLSSDEQEAWRNGAVAMLRLVGNNCMAMAGGIEANGEGGYDLPDDAQQDEEDDETCPECGGELVASFGGDRCLSCDYHEPN